MTKYQLCYISSVLFSSVAQSCLTLWRPYGHQGSMSITLFWSLLKLMSIESVMRSNHLILCHSPFPPVFNLSKYQGIFQ